MRRAAGVVAILVAATPLLSGCRTDELWRERQKPNGPVTAIDNPEGIDLPDIKIVDAQEVDLVERLLTHRAMYFRTLRALHDYYRVHGFETKRVWTSQELAEVKNITPFRYLLSAEIPAEELRPTESIAEADALFDRALRIMKEGGNDIPALYRRDKMKEALGVFTELIERFPSSDKIDDVAFYCGEIHKEYFEGHEPIAVKWYQRAWQWDARTPHPARFQAAVVYDYRLHNRAAALELYQRVLDEENENRSNVSWATRRIHELSRTVGEPLSRRQTTRSEALDMFGAPLSRDGDTSGTSDEPGRP